MKSVEHISAATASTATCDYCGLPLSGTALPGEPAYCCFGCRFSAGISNPAVMPIGPLNPAGALGLSAFFTMNVVMLTMALWAYTESQPSQFQLALGNFLRYGAMAFSLPVLLLLGDPLVSHAVSGLRRGQFTTDLLLATGVVAAFTVSVMHTIRGGGHVYFEVGCVILVLVTVGRWLEAAGRSQATSALDQLERLVPLTVRRRIHRHDIETPRSHVLIGHHIHVLAGERFPLDGCVVQGRAVVDEQFFTGESTPVEKQFGDHVVGGSLNLDGDLIIEVTESANSGALGRLVQAVRAARLTKGRYQLLSDAWSRRFFPIISGVAAVTFFYHGMRTNWDDGLLAALSVVLISCPCALALATPLAVWAAMGTAAKRGVLFRGGAALETLSMIKVIRWDKTGTITTGTPRVLQFFCEDASERNDVEQTVADLTHASRHVHAHAIRDYLTGTAPSDSLVQIQTIAGRGLQALDSEGRQVRLGSIRWMKESGCTWGPHLSQVLENSNISVSPMTAIAQEGQVKGLFLLEESVRPEALAAIQKCRELGLNQAVLTGDHAARAAILAKEIGLPVQAELLPEDKLAAIHSAKACLGKVAMIGDGLNDAPALAGADIGIALGCGADVSRDSADVCLLSSDLRQVAWTYELSRQTVRTIRTNLAWSFGYNSLGVIVAACGQLHPAMAAGLMVASSIMVLGNSLRLTSDAFGVLPPGTDSSVDLASSKSGLQSNPPTEFVP